MAKKKQALLTGLALLASCFPLAFRLGRAPLQTWDEARQAANAFEMLHSGGQWLVTTFAYRPDLWNTKPPLLIWLQALSMAVLGPTLLAVRLPTLLATVSTVGLLYLAGRRLGRPGRAAAGRAASAAIREYFRAFCGKKHFWPASQFAYNKSIKCKIPQPKPTSKPASAASWSGSILCTSSGPTSRASSPAASR